MSNSRSMLLLSPLSKTGGRPTIVAVVRYVFVADDRAEVAFMVIDAYQGKGLGTLLLRHLTTIARSAGLRRFVAEVLSENRPMLEVFGKCGLRMSVHIKPRRHAHHARFVKFCPVAKYV